MYLVFVGVETVILGLLYYGNDVTVRQVFSGMRVASANARGAAENGRACRSKYAEKFLLLRRVTSRQIKEKEKKEKKNKSGHSLGVG